MSTTDTEMTPEPEWLAAEPTGRAKLAAIMAAVRRCYSECPCDGGDERSGPHMTTAMAEVLIGQMMAASPPRCPTPCDPDCEQPCHEVHAVPSRQGHDPRFCVAAIVTAAVAAERERIRKLAVANCAVCNPDFGHRRGFAPFADLLREPSQDSPLTLPADESGAARTVPDRIEGAS